jgi:hypothetical protein
MDREIEIGATIVAASLDHRCPLSPSHTPTPFRTGFRLAQLEAHSAIIHNIKF